MSFALVMSDDDIPTILQGGTIIGRALTKRDGEAIVAALNKNTTAIRDRLIAEVTDAIENAFEGAEQ
jgi:hypothetical protein